MKTRVLLVGTCLLVSGVARMARADDVPPPVVFPPPLIVPPPPELLPPPTAAPPAPPPAPDVVVPTHLRVGNQQFDASVGGLRAYLDATKTTDPKLYAALAPDVERLESQRDGAVIAVAVGAALGVAAEIFAFVGRSDCAEPALGDPNFAAKSAAWGACDDQNIKHMALYGALGLGALAAGGITALAIAPKRSDIMEVLNKNNRLAPQPLQLELGYDPARRYAFAGAGVSF